MAAICQRNRRNFFLPQLKILISTTTTTTHQKFNQTLAGGGIQLESKSEQGQIEFTKWRKLDARSFGITGSVIPLSPWLVMRRLRAKGFEAYLVGGCVRDLILHRIPKDFDVITTAGLHQIKKQFNRAIIVGRRFPICMVSIRDTVVEVSSFDTGSEQVGENNNYSVPRMPRQYDEKDIFRWRNSMHRDFTINSLFYDPFKNIIYDYANAMADLKSLKLQTLIPAHSSFEEDSARILRGMRFAARLNFTFSEEIDTAIRKLSQSIQNINTSRLMGEVSYMLSYGAAVPSLNLLQRYNLLQVLLPFHAAYLAQQAIKQSSETIQMLMKLFSSLDKLVSCNRPTHDSVWVAILAFHLTLVNNPQDMLVVLTFASVLYHGKWESGVEFAKRHVKAAISYLPEISDSDGGFILEDAVLGERVKNLAVQVQTSAHMLIDANSLHEMTSKLSGATSSCLVFISKNMVKNAVAFLDILVNDVTSLNTRRESLQIDYRSLVKGHARETRCVLGAIILDTLGLGDSLAVMRTNRNRNECPEMVDKKRAENSEMRQRDHKMSMPREKLQGKDTIRKEIAGEDRVSQHVFRNTISRKRYGDKDEDLGEARGRRKRDLDSHILGSSGKVEEKVTLYSLFK
ncbi:hypothetical protein DM860_017287 [Cuscuta australis]|uniref:Poly A polymerase head domain-containing protein n=1 Tax=Cuscuta australis TaxID=267555 RepID=A0A328E7W9_9ASTE|nr:hypothetical protein DM860_017287 [Cuscuta australis]